MIFKQITNQSKRYTYTTYNFQVLRLQSVSYTCTTCFQALKLQVLHLLNLKVATTQYYATLILEKRKLPMRRISRLHLTPLQPLICGFASYICVLKFRSYICV